MTSNDNEARATTPPSGPWPTDGSGLSTAVGKNGSLIVKSVIIKPWYAGTRHWLESFWRKPRTQQFVETENMINSKNT
jgi:hypothetical protein